MFLWDVCYTLVSQGWVVLGSRLEARAGKRENNGLDVAIILDPLGLNCPNHEKICACKSHGLLFFLTRMYIANRELNQIAQQIFRSIIFREIHIPTCAS